MIVSIVANYSVLVLHLFLFVCYYLDFVYFIICITTILGRPVPRFHGVAGTKSWRWETVLDAVRKQVEECDQLDAVHMSEALKCPYTKNI